MSGPAQLSLTGAPSPAPSSPPGAPTGAGPAARLRCAPWFGIDGEVLERFNAYATAALPCEVGGLLRVVGEGERFRAVELAVLAQQASASTFDLDPDAVARFLLARATQGGPGEAGQWRALIHSHPRMAPFLSARDERHLRRLASSGGHAFSLIVSADPDPRRNFQAVHYAQTAPCPLVLEGLRVGVEGRCHGVEHLGAAQLEAIRGEVSELVRPAAAGPALAIDQDGPGTDIWAGLEAIEAACGVALRRGGRADDPLLVTELALATAWTLSEHESFVLDGERLAAEGAEDLPEKPCAASLDDELAAELAGVLREAGEEGVDPDALAAGLVGELGRAARRAGLLVAAGRRYRPISDQQEQR